MNSFRFLTITVLTSVLVLSLTLNAYGVTELSYDDGVEETYYCPDQNTWRAVKFIFSDFGLQGSWKLLTASFYGSTVETAKDQLELHVLTSDGSADLAGSTPITFTPTSDWNNIDLSGQNIVVSGDFWVAYKWLGQFAAPCLAMEYSPPPIDGRSFYGSPGSWTADDTYDYLIRAQVEQISAPTPVGGVAVPVNKLDILAPYLALLGLVGAVTVAVAAKMRGRKT